jgi:hypothetical protein
MLIIPVWSLAFSCCLAMPAHNISFDKLVLNVDHLDYIDFEVLVQCGYNITFKSTQPKARGLKITFQ